VLRPAIMFVRYELDEPVSDQRAKRMGQSGDADGEALSERLQSGPSMAAFV